MRPRYVIEYYAFHCNRHPTEVGSHAFSQGLMWRDALEQTTFWRECVDTAICKYDELYHMKIFSCQSEHTVLETRQKYDLHDGEKWKNERYALVDARPIKPACGKHFPFADWCGILSGTFWPSSCFPTSSRKKWLTDCRLSLTMLWCPVNRYWVFEWLHLSSVERHRSNY